MQETSECIPGTNSRPGWEMSLPEPWRDAVRIEKTELDGLRVRLGTGWGGVKRLPIFPELSECLPTEAQAEKNFKVFP